MHAGYLPSHFKQHPLSTNDTGLIPGYTYDGWYFWDESEAYAIGPYDTFAAAEKARASYKP